MSSQKLVRFTSRTDSEIETEKERDKENESKKLMSGSDEREMMYFLSGDK